MVINFHNKPMYQNLTYCFFFLIFQSLLGVSALKNWSYLCICHLECCKALFVESNIQLRTKLCVILLDLNPVQ